MSGLAFIDANILIYADDRSDRRKQSRAIKLITELQRSSRIVLSLQVLQEYFAAATRKLGVDPELAQRKVQLLARGQVVRFEPDDIVAAIELHRLSRVSFWDALIIHAARLAGASVLYSEDLQHRSTIGGVSIVNPFSEIR